MSIECIVSHFREIWFVLMVKSNFSSVLRMAILLPVLHYTCIDYLEC